jgi:hypothetical protein
MAAPVKIRRSAAFISSNIYFPTPFLFLFRYIKGNNFPSAKHQKHAQLIFFFLEPRQRTWKLSLIQLYGTDMVILDINFYNKRDHLSNIIFYQI